MALLLDCLFIACLNRNFSFCLLLRISSLLLSSDLLVSISDQNLKLLRCNACPCPVTGIRSKTARLDLKMAPEPGFVEQAICHKLTAARTIVNLIGLFNTG